MLRIKEILKVKGVNQIELAEKLHVTRVGLNRTINGNPTIETLRKIANALDVDVRELIEPTTATGATSLYIKDEKGNLTEVGLINAHKLTANPPSETTTSNP